jgi:hypothetical protein
MMLLSVASCTKRGQIVQFIVTEPAALRQMMNVQVFRRTNSDNATRLVLELVGEVICILRR